MARILQLPAEVISKTPTADLWEGQSDEAELGISYQELDEILIHLTETLVQPDYPMETINRVVQLIKQSEFKRQMPPVLERF